MNVSVQKDERRNALINQIVEIIGGTNRILSVMKAEDIVDLLAKRDNPIWLVAEMVDQLPQCTAKVVNAGRTITHGPCGNCWTCRATRLLASVGQLS